MAARVAPGGWREVQARLADRHPTTEDYLAALTSGCGTRAGRAPRSSTSLTWPEYPIRFVPIPPRMQDAAPLLYYLYYRSPAPFDRLQMHEYHVAPMDLKLLLREQLERLRATNTGVIKLNHVVHHAAIGHHVQNYYAYHGVSEIGRVAAVDCASRIGMFLGGTMAEGWACYATDLMEEAAGSSRPRSPWRTAAEPALARAVADIRLHEGS